MFGVEEIRIVEKDRRVRRLSGFQLVAEGAPKRPRDASVRVRAQVLLLGLLLGGCAMGPDNHAYESAEEAAYEEDWSRAADLWYQIHLAERVKTPRPYLETARALYLEGDHESACEMLREGLLEFPENASLLSYYSWSLEELGFKRAAEVYYLRLVEADPDNPKGWMGLGRVRVGLGHELAAEQPLRRALLLAPGDSEPHVHLARVSQVAGDLPQAFDHYSMAIDLGEHDLSFLLDASAVSIEDEVLTTRPDARTRGLEWIAIVLESDPQSTCAHYLKGVHFELSGQKDEALVSYMRAVETDPSCVQALSKLATMFADAGDEPRKVEMAMRALDIEQDPVRRQVLEEMLAEPRSSSPKLKH